MPKWLLGTFHILFRDSRCSGRENPLSLELPVAEMPKWILALFRISRFGFSRCSGRVAPLSLELLVAEMPKWLLGTFTFRVSVSGIPDAVEERAPLVS
jgi:hypothetical protein